MRCVIGETRYNVAIKSILIDICRANLIVRIKYYVSNKKFLVLLQTVQVIPLKCGYNCINCTHCKENYICFKKWLDSEDEQITLYNAEI